MNVTVNYRIAHNRLPEIIAKMPGLVSAVVKKTAFDIEEDARNFCPVDTGALQGSIEANVEEFYATIAPATEYAGYVEFGTWKMAAQPYMRPAADKNAPKFEAAMAAALASL